VLVRPGADIAKIDVAAAIPSHSTGFSGAVTVMLKIQGSQRRNQFLDAGTDQHDAVTVSRRHAEAEQSKRAND